MNYCPRMEEIHITRSIPQHGLMEFCSSTSYCNKSVDVGFNLALLCHETYLLELCLMNIINISASLKIGHPITDKYFSNYPDYLLGVAASALCLCRDKVFMKPL